MQYFDDHFPKTTFSFFFSFVILFDLTKCLIFKFLIGSTTDQKERDWWVGVWGSFFLLLLLPFYFLNLVFIKSPWPRPNA